MKKTISITPEYKQLLEYIVEYENTKGRSSNRELTQRLILEKAKRLVTAVPNELWRANLLTLINECEE